MDASIVTAIADLAAAEQTNHLIEENELPTLIVPNSHQLCSIERFLPAPKRFRAQFETASLTDFLNYYNKHMDGNTSLFVDDSDLTANAIFDLGTPKSPLWSEHKATLTMAKTGHYSMLLACENKRMNQTSILEFFDDFRPNVEFFNTDNNGDKLDIGFRDAYSALSSLTVQKLSEADKTEDVHSASSSTYDKLDVNSRRGTLPEYFAFSTPPYREMEAIQVNCRLRIYPDMTFKYQIIGKDEINKLIVDKFVEEFSEFVCYVGRMSIPDFS